jgi:tetratricopeptide (TPR) repeat protein
MCYTPGSDPATIGEGKMSRKKSGGSRRQPGDSKPDAGPPPIDNRSMERMMQDLHRLLEEQEFETEDQVNAFLNDLMASGKPIPFSASSTPLEKAQDIMYGAWEARSRSQRIKLAKQALAISEDCADAYTLLAGESAKTPEEALELYEQAVRAGERALGPEIFEEEVGNFWFILETRPYMRARTGLAQTLWMMGERKKAVDHYRDLLRLNPNDNQGLRYILLTFLLEMGDDPAAEKLVKKYEGDYSAYWMYNRALLAFRRRGATPHAARQLKEAIAYNPHVPPYLLGRKKLPRQMPAYISPGEDDEALDYVESSALIWHQTDGALTWLRGVFDEEDEKSAG